MGPGLSQVLSPRRVGVVVAATAFFLGTGALRAALAGPVTISVGSVVLAAGLVLVWLSVVLEITSRLIGWAGCRLVGESPDATTALVVGIGSFVFAGSFTTRVFAEGGVEPAALVTLVVANAIGIAVVTGVLRFIAARRV